MQSGAMCLAYMCQRERCCFCDFFFVVGDFLFGRQYAGIRFEMMGWPMYAREGEREREREGEGEGEGEGVKEREGERERACVCV